MQAKRLLSLIIAGLLCLSSLTAFAEEQQVTDISEEAVEEIIVPSEEKADDPTEVIVEMPNDESDGSIDYSDMYNWAYWSEGEGKDADLFFICPTVDMGDAGNYLADITSEGYRKYFVGATKQELGIYSDVTSIYAPYYRQATFPVYSMEESEREKYLTFAYEDIKDAFLYYVENSDPTRPLILAGFSQGADLTIRLMKDLFDEPQYQRRLVAAYCIGWKLTEAEITEYPHLIPATAEKDTGVIIAFNSESEDITSSLIIGENEKTYAINPLNWTVTTEKADKSLNKGACFTDYSGNIKEEIPSLTGAYIDEKRGALKVPDVTTQDYPGKIFEDGIYHLYDYQFFFRNLQENVKTRLSAYNEKYADRIDILYNDDILFFDVEPVIENGRTLVPFRGIFEAMGCAVGYVEADGKMIVSARRGNDSLMLTVGEDKMYFNGEEKALDVPAKITNSRTLVPLRAVSEAFECDVLWDGDRRNVYIYSPAEYHSVIVGKLSETVADDNGNALVEAVAYYPVIENPNGMPFIDEINESYKKNAEGFLEEARGKREDALILSTAMGEAFIPFTFEMTYEQTYNYGGNISFTTYKYMNLGGAHPTTVTESKTFNTGLEEELSLSKIIDEEYLRTSLELSLSEYVKNLFVERLKELDADNAEAYTNDYVTEYIGSLQFYITRNSVVLYFNQGEIVPYALGEVSVEIPYAPELFYIDMHLNCLDEYVFELEFDKDCDWMVGYYSDGKLAFTEESIKYDPETLISENHPEGMTKIAVKGIGKGNAGMILVHKKKGDDEGIKNIILVSFLVDENNKITLVSENDGMFLLK